VLKTPRAGTTTGGSRGRRKISGIAGTIAGDDTVLIITPNKRARESLQRRIEALVR